MIIQISKDTGLSTIAKQLILGDILENKIPNEKNLYKYSNGWTFTI